MITEKKLITLFSTLIAISSLTLVSHVAGEKMGVSGLNPSMEEYIVEVLSPSNNYDSSLATNKSSDNSTYWNWMAGVQKVEPAVMAGDFAWVDTKLQISQGTIDWHRADSSGTYWMYLTGGASGRNNLSYTLEISVYGFRTLQFNYKHSDATPIADVNYKIEVFSGANCTGTVRTYAGDGMPPTIWGSWQWGSPQISLAKSFRLSMYGCETYKMGRVRMTLVECTEV